MERTPALATGPLAMATVWTGPAGAASGSHPFSLSERPQVPGAGRRHRGQSLDAVGCGRNVRSVLSGIIHAGEKGGTL
jgi:hypothetical protein